MEDIRMRRRRVAISHEMMAEVLLGRARLKLPADAQIYAIDSDNVDRVLRVGVVSVEFAVLDAGALAPVLHAEMEWISTPAEASPA